MKPLRVAHCSDIHLDASIHEGADGNDDYYRAAFESVIGAMLSHSPDMVLVAGDLFDANTASDFTISWAMETLASVAVPVALIPGNHDCMEHDAIYRRYNFGGIANVTALLAEQGELVRFEDLGVCVWGRGMADHHPGYAPLAGCPEKPPDIDWFIGLGHGIFVPRGGETHRSSPVRMEEIDASPCDYIALGHHHAALDVSSENTAAAYCGSPTDPVGGSETYVIVDFEPGAATQPKFHNVDNSEHRRAG